MKKKLFSIVLSLALIVTMMPAMALTANAASDPYLTQEVCFTVTGGKANIALAKTGTSAPDLSFQYYIDNSDKEEWTDYETNSPLTITSSQALYFRIKATPEVKALAVNDKNYWHFVTTGVPENGGSCEISVSGNILSLLYPTDFASKADEILGANAFNGLFAKCGALVDASNLKLPSTKLAKSCYDGLFYQSPYLKKAPELPAQYLAEGCYAYMFNGCTALTDVPDLSVKVMALNSCSLMFSDCSSLTKAPNISAIKQGQNSCAGMFLNCTSLVTAPEIKSTELAMGCYSEMFYGCTALKNPPVLSSKTLAICCYYNMFQGCTSLVKAPELPATTLEEQCYTSMFAGCTSLEAAPELPATVLANECYGGMFIECEKLVNAPKLPATKLANGCYRNMFRECTSLDTMPELPATELAELCYSRMFEGCTKLKKASLLPAKNIAPHAYEKMFNRCSNLSEVHVYLEGNVRDAALGMLDLTAPVGIFYGTSSFKDVKDVFPEGWQFVDIVEYEKELAEKEKAEREAAIARIMDPIYFAVGVATVATTAAVVVSIVKNHGAIGDLLSAEALTNLPKISSEVLTNLPKVSSCIFDKLPKLSKLSSCILTKIPKLVSCIYKQEKQESCKLLKTLLLLKACKLRKTCE